MSLPELSDEKQAWYILQGYTIVEDENKIGGYLIRFWFKDNKQHREDGPAIEYSDRGYEYYINGLLHRVEGPAVSYPGYRMYYINGKKVSQKEHVSQRHLNIQIATKEEFEKQTLKNNGTCYPAQ